MKLLIIGLACLMLLLSGCTSPAATPSTSAPTTVTAFNVSPETISLGQKATLKWEVTGPAFVRIEPELGNVGASGNIEVKPYTTTTYILTAGEQENKVVATVTLTVGPGKPIVEFFITETPEITLGKSGRLSWNVIGATSVSIDNNIGPVAASGSVLVTPTTTTVYTLTATNAEGSITATTMIVNQSQQFRMGNPE
jgi:hypothetical protein